MSVTPDETVVSEVRALTKYDDTIVSTIDMAVLLSRAKKELEADVGDTVDFTNPTANTALFWLLALFTKIHTGDIGSVDFAVGELESASLDTESNLWLQSYHSRREQLRGTTGVVFGHRKTARSDRTYGVY